MTSHAPDTILHMSCKQLSQGGASIFNGKRGKAIKKQMNKMVSAELSARKKVCIGVEWGFWRQANLDGTAGEREDTGEVGRGQLVQTLGGPGKEYGLCSQSLVTHWGALKRRGRTLEGRKVNMLCVKKVILSCREQIRSRETHWDVSITENHRLVAYKPQDYFSPFWRSSFQKLKVTDCYFSLQKKFEVVMRWPSRKTLNQKGLHTRLSKE